MKNFDSDEYAYIVNMERKRIIQLPLNEQYQQQFTYCGKTYYYDPDYDCFYPITPWEELSYWDKYGWLWMTAALTVICYILSIR